MSNHTSQLTIIKFSDWIKSLVSNGVHNGVCSCQRMFGTRNELDFGNGVKRARLLEPKVHCPSCGSGWIMNHKGAGKLVRITEGEIEYFISSGGRVCRKCGCVFDEYKVFTSCKADPPAALVKYQEKARKADEAAKSVGLLGGIQEFKEKMLEFARKRQEEKEKE